MVYSLLYTLIPLHGGADHGFWSNHNLRDHVRVGVGYKRSLDGRSELRTLSARGVVLVKAAPVTLYLSPSAMRGLGALIPRSPRSVCSAAGLLMLTRPRARTGPRVGAV